MLSALLKYVEPTIPLEEISIMDTQTPDSKHGLEDISIKKTQTIGRVYPYLRIDGYTFNFHDITYMEIDMSGALPKYNFTIVDTAGVFAGSHLPKSDIIASLYIKSSNDEVYNPIRNDIYITKVIPMGKATEDLAADGKGITYSIRGILFIPLINSAARSVVLSGTSKESLEMIARQLGLGFVTNESTTYDKMNWIKSESTFKLVDEITTHSYKDDNSFYTWFIDQYYCLNFINIADILNSADEPIEKIFPNYIGHINNLMNPNEGISKEKINNIPAEFVLSNHSALIGLDTFISSYQIKAKQGTILNDFSRKHRLYFYDPDEDRDNLKNNFIEHSIYSYDIYKIKNDSISKSERYYNGGIDYHNTHDNYIAAKLINKKNLAELDQINLIVETNEMNYHIIRGMRLPVVIMKQGLDTKNEDAQEPNPTSKSEELIQLEKNLQFNINTMLSGMYYVKDIKYVYNLYSGDRFFFKTILTLTKNVWSDKITE